MQIWIPSRGRPRVLEQTFHALPEVWQKRVRIALTEGDPTFDIYKFIFRGVPLHVLPAKGIADKRRMIGEYVDGGTFFLMDDDIKFFRRKAPDDYHLVDMRPTDWDVMFNTVLDLLIQGYGAVGVSAREGNNRLEPDGVENTRIMRAVGYNRETFLRCEHGRVEVMEDFDVLLQILKQGFKTYNISEFAQDQRMTNAPGGCSLWRTHELHETAARRLAELHPGIVSLRQKQNKTGGAFGTRTEVTIQWKKAYDRN